MNAVIGSRGIKCVIKNTGRPIVMPASVTYDSEVLNWISRTITNGSSGVSDSTKNAANTFMTSIKAAGLRSKIYRLNLFAGNDYRAGLTPLINDKGNLHDFGGSSSDWSGVGVYSESYGFYSQYPNSRIMDTGVVPSSAYANGNNAHLSIYARTAEAESSVSIGLVNSGDALSQFELIIRFAGASNLTLGLCCETAGSQWAGDTTGLGFFHHNRTASNASALYHNGISVATNTPSGYTLSSIPIYVCAQNDSAFGARFFSYRNYAGYSIGLGMDATESLAFYNAWQTFQTALGRQV